MRITTHPIFLQATALTSAFFIVMLPACTFLTPAPGPSPYQDNHAVADYSRHVSGEFYFNLLAAQMCINSGDWNNARDFYYKALEMAPASSYILLQLSHLAVILGEPDQAEQYCRLVLEQNPRFFEARRFMARFLSSRDQTDEALYHYRLLLAEQPGDEEILLAIATLYVRQKQPEKALDAINTLLEAHPQSAAAFFHSGAIHAELNNPAAAERAYVRAIALDPEFLPARINLAGLLEDAGDSRRAIAIYQDAAELSPGHRRVRSKLAYLHVKIGNFDAALSHYRYLLDTAEQFDEDIALRMGLVYFEQGNYTDAERILQSILANNPDNQRACYYLGHTFTKMLKPEDAARAFSAVTVESDVFVQARIELVLLYSRGGDTEKALQVLQEALDVRPNDTSLYHARAVLHAQLRDYPAAIAALQQAIAIDSTAEHLFYYLGYIYEKAGMFDESIAAMRAVLAINSTNADALNFIGYLYADRGIRLREARTMIKKALVIKPDDGYILDSLGWVYFKMGSYKKARTHLERAHATVPDDPTIVEHLGDVWQRLGRTDKARAFYLRALELEPERQSTRQKIDDLDLKP